jgi:hypothetical protein
MLRPLFGRADAQLIAHVVGQVRMVRVAMSEDGE